MGLIGGENRRHHHLLASRVLPMMFECMFDSPSQHPPSDTVKKRGGLFDTTGTHVASGAFRLRFYARSRPRNTITRSHQRERDILDQRSGRPAVARISRRAAAGSASRNI